MKPIHYILLTIVVLVISFFGYDYYKKKNIAITPNNDAKDGKNYIPSKNNAEIEKVKALQRSLNNVLKLHNKTLLVVDGIKGKLTKQAIIDVANLQSKTPAVSHIAVNRGGHEINVNINFDAVYSKTKQLVKDLSGYSAMSNLFS